MKRQPLTKEQINQILEQEKVNVCSAFQLQMKDSLFHEMMLKIWNALFIQPNPAGKQNTSNFLKSFNSTMYENFEKSFEENYKLYSEHNQFAISQADYRESFQAALQFNLEEMIGYFELDKKILMPS